MSFRKDLYPFTGLTLSLNGNSLHYLDEGAGEPLILIHGNPTWSFFYRNLVKGLSGQFQVIVPDHIGCGLSDKPDDQHYEYTLDRRAKDLEALIDHLNIKRPLTIIAHDWGGMIGMVYAMRHPERIGRLILMNTAGFHLPKTTHLPPSLWMCRKTWLADLLIRRTGLFCRLVTRWCCERPMSEDVRDGYLHPYQTAKDRLAHLRFVQDIPLKPGDPSYELVSNVQSSLPLFRKTPTLILWGEKDFVFDLHFLKVWEQELPHATVHRFPQAGHLLLEDAGDETLFIIQKFLRDNPI